MANEFNDNLNKKDLNGDSISFTTYRVNYPNDTSMRNGGGMPSGGSGFDGLKYVYEDCLFVDDELSTDGGTMNGIYYYNSKGYNLINCAYSYNTGAGGSGEDTVSFEVGGSTEEVTLTNDPIAIE